MGAITAPRTSSSRSGLDTGTLDTAPRFEATDSASANTGGTVGNKEPESVAGVELPAMSANVQLASGRRYALESRGEGTDRLTVRGRDGQIVLRVTVTESGPVLAFQAAELELSGTRTLRLDGERIEVSAGELRTYVGGDAETRITGSRHTRIDGAERLEAAEVQVQASTGALEARAAGRIALDGEHIGLNDDPCPAPFAWTSLTEEEAPR